MDLQSYMYLVYLEMGRLFAGEEDRGGMVSTRIGWSEGTSERDGTDSLRV